MPPSEAFCILVLYKESRRWAGCTNQIPLTIKPYPMKNQI
jgi:hypothetical protein